MEEFLIPVVYQGEELEFRAKLRSFGYSYKIEVEVYGQKILFEQDEEQRYRAWIGPEMMISMVKYDLKLFKAIAEVIDAARGLESQS
jgi:hypothetical protein